MQRELSTARAWHGLELLGDRLAHEVMREPQPAHIIDVLDQNSGGEGHFHRLESLLTVETGGSFQDAESKTRPGRDREKR